MFYKKICSVAAVAVVAMGVGGVADRAEAASLIGVFPGNDAFPRNLVLRGYGIDTPGLAKCDGAEFGSCDWEYNFGTLYDGAFTVTFDAKVGGEYKSGGWSFTAPSPTALVPNVLVVKAGDEFAAYTLHGATSGFWSTADLGNKGVSHVTFYDTEAAAIPLPAAGWLLLSGLGGLGVLARRKRAAA